MPPASRPEDVAVWLCWAVFPLALVLAPLFLVSLVPQPIPPSGLRPAVRPCHPRSPRAGSTTAGGGNTVSPSSLQRLGPHRLLSLFHAGPAPEHPTTAHRPLRFKLSLFTAGEPRPFSGPLYEKGPCDLALLASVVMLSILPCPRGLDSVHAPAPAMRTRYVQSATFPGKSVQASWPSWRAPPSGALREHRVTTSSVTQAARGVLRQGSAHLAVYYTYPNTSTATTDILQRTAL
ncbi:hypothetical protein DFH09DRAFT_1086282 [Mycena vulgaris]|nr:hypothetical protein DFH09DRAFT_1086282 [Mycena vulgaris]